VLDDAAAESRKIYDKTLLTSALHTALQRQALLSSSTFTATNPSATTPTTSSNPAPAWVQPPLPLTGAAAVVGLHQKINDLEEAVESLLQATKNTIPLAQLLLTLPPQDDRVRSLHRTFLSILSKCGSALNELSSSTTATTTATTSTTPTPKRKNAMLVPVLDHPLLDKTLRLAVRARGDLGLPLHLPLYQTLARSVAQLSSSSSSYNYTSHTTTNWIVQLANWAQEDFNLHHPNGSGFFLVSSPLCILAQRQRYGELAHLLTTILTSPNFSMNYVDESTLHQLIRILYDDLYTHLWEEPPATTTTRHNNNNNNKNKRKRPPPLLRSNSNNSNNSNNNPHQMTMALQELLFVLEPSIWKLFGEVVSSSSSSSIPPESSSLREAIDVLISTTTSSSSSSLVPPGQHQHSSPEAAAAAAAAASLLSSKELLHALFPDEFSDDSQEFWEDDDDTMDQLDEDEDDEDDFFETNRHLTSGKWELHVDMDSDLSIVSITRRFADDDDDENDDNEDDDDDDWSREVPPSVQWQRLETVPDIVQQIEVAAGQPLRYSKRLQRDLLHQFVEG
jgi:hypothetical protein